MKKLVILSICLLLIPTLSQGQLLKNLVKKAKEVQSKTQTSSTSLSADEVAKGLKEALNQGVKKGVAQLSQKGGYLNNPEVKIPLPAEAKKVESKLRKMGQGKLVDDAVRSINHAAEDAAVEAKDLFVAAIGKMSIDDAMKILKGDKDAATKYLSANTRADLVLKFKPIIEKSLAKNNATQYWSKMFSVYNKIPMVKKVNPNLTEYATNKAIDGLFLQIAKEELSIRQDPKARVSDILKKVFA